MDRILSIRTEENTVVIFIHLQMNLELDSIVNVESHRYLQIPLWIARNTTYTSHCFKTAVAIEAAAGSCYLAH